MTTAEFLSNIRDLGINLWLDGDDLRYSAPKGTLTQELRAELVRRKAEILTFLHEMQVVAPSDPDKAVPEVAGTCVAPRTPTEEALIRIWIEVLGVERVGIHDNFFDLGGDSVVALRVVARANQAGLRFIPRQILEHQTVAELAAVEGTLASGAEQGEVTGPVPLMPYQRWFFDQQFENPHHANVATLFEVHRDLDPVLVAQVLEHLLVHHDALRTRFVRQGRDWRAFIAVPDGTVPFTYIDVSDLPPAKRRAAIESTVDRLHRSLDLSAGPLLRVALFNLGAREPGRLLVTMHHVVTDTYSDFVFWEDFLLVYGQLSRREEVQLPAKTTSVRQWGECLIAHVQSSEFRQELDYWLTLPWAQVRPLPVDRPIGRDCINASCRTLTKSLGTEETDLLLYEMPGFYGVQGLDVLLTALVEAVSGWTGGRWVPIVVPHSGRSTIPGVGTLDLSRTMGCLIQHRLVMLGREETDDPEVALRSIHEQFRRIPNWGLGYRMLLYYSREARVVEQLAALLPYAAKIEFNYISAQRDGRSRRDRTVFRPAREFIGIVGDVQNPVTNLLACNACVVNGQLSLEWWYSASVHEHTTIEKVCTDFEEALRALIARYRSRAMHSPPRS